MGMYAPNKYQMLLDWTLAVCVRVPATWTEPVKYIHTNDLDAKLTLAYWHEGQGLYGWELDAAEIDGIKVTAETDRDLWQIIKRAVDYHETSINERVQDYAHEVEAA